ncbi:MAG: sulfatase-like hydrolase/transferase [Silvanigrellaceae bacterium]
MGLPLFAVVLLFVDQLTVRFSTFKAVDLLTWRYWVNQVLSLFFIYGLMTLIAQSFHVKPFKERSWVRRWLLVANTFEMLFFLTVQVNHFLIYQKPISSFTLRFLFENPKLSAELSLENMQVFQTVFLVAPALVLMHAFFSKAETESPPGKRRVWLGGFLFLLSVVVSTFAWFSAPVVQHSLLSLTTAFSDFIRFPVGGRNFASGGANRVQIPLERLRCGGFGDESAKAPSIIWVVGESVVASRLSIYGHSRPTTPFLAGELAAGRLVKFKDVVSIGTVTRISLPYLFFGMQGPDSNGQIFSQPSVFDFAKAAGLKTAFIGAQELRWGNQDKIIINENVDIYSSGTDFDRKAGVSTGADDFEVFKRGVVPFLNTVDSPFFAAFHMDGSHYPYSRHSHARYKKFLPETNPNDANAYDNTLVQLDDYLNQLMQVVRNKHPSAWVFYTSDHGQNISKQSKFNSGFADDVIRVPLFVFPPLSEVKSPAKLEKMGRQVSSPVSHSDMFATTLSLLGCKSASLEQRDSKSLFEPISPNRLRVVSELMSSHFVDDRFAVVASGGNLYEVDSVKRTVVSPKGEVLRIADWNAEGAQATRLKAEVEHLLQR